MTDRELLELAAKAAGYKVRWHDVLERFIHKGSYKTDEERMQDYMPLIVWAPLENNGDAFKLAVDCRMMNGINKALDVLLFHLFGTGDAENKYAAVRLAIVRAAAEIGKNR